MAGAACSLEGLGLKMRVLVTGHNGYIGSVMVDVLHAAGHSVVGLDAYFFENCGITQAERIPAFRKDLRDVTHADLQGFEAIVHLAALCNDPLGDLNPDWTNEINFKASLRLAQLARDAGVKRFLYASSCSMYGKAGDDALTEESPLRPLTPYAVSKIRTEEEVSKLADDDFSPVFLRNATAYGWSVRLRADVVLNNLVCWAHATGKVRIMSDGTPWRPLVHVEDISRVAAAALGAPRSAIHNQAFNVGVNEENYRVRDLAAIVSKTVPNCVVEYAAGGGPDPRSYRVSFNKLARLLPEFKPTWTAATGAQQVYQHIKEAAITLADFQGPRFTRLAQFKSLLEAGMLNDTLRWKTNGQDR